VEHSLPHVRSPWRTATLVASAVAAVELVLLVALGVALLAEPVSKSLRSAAEQQVLAPVAKPKPRPKAAATRPTLTRAETAVTVLNGNGRSGAAAAAADSVRRFGYTIGTVGNAPRTDVTRTIVMYRDGYRPEAARLAKDLGVKIVGPLDGLRKADLLGAHVALVLGD
jgi:hypothetical protein